MLRIAVKSSPVFGRIAVATSIARQKLLNPSIITAPIVNTCRLDLAAYSSSASCILFPSFMSQARGYARGRPTPPSDSELPDDDSDSEDLVSDGDDFSDNDDCEERPECELGLDDSD